MPKPTHLQEFTNAYIEAAMFFSHDERDDTGGERLDHNYSPEDIAPESLSKLEEDCLVFFSAYSELFNCDNAKEGDYYGADARAGHDFWLTRSGHGCGFWDGDWKEPAATILADAAKRFGECCLYVGDDGMIYC